MLTPGERLGFEARRNYVPRRSVSKEERGTIVQRYGRRWIWDMTVSIPLPAIQKVSENDIENSLRKEVAALLKIEERKLQVELVQTAYDTSERHLAPGVLDETSPLGSASVIIDGQPQNCIQLVLWSQWNKNNLQKKLPSWIEEPPPRNSPKPARNYLATVSLPALLALFRHRKTQAKLAVYNNAEDITVSSSLVPCAAGEAHKHNHNASCIAIADNILLINNNSDHKKSCPSCR